MARAQGYTRDRWVNIGLGRKEIAQCRAGGRLGMGCQCLPLGRPRYQRHTQSPST
jgi:hypothetical protein